MPKLLLRLLLIGFALATSITEGRAAERIFRPFTWFYEFDGTDATLAGISFLTTNLKHAVSFRFECSKERLHLRVYGEDFWDLPRPEGGGTATVQGGEVELSTSWFGGAVHALTNRDSPEAGPFAKQLLKLSAAFFRDSSRELKVTLQAKNGTALDLRYTLQPQSLEYSGRNEIARFREKCAGWWQSLL